MPVAWVEGASSSVAAARLRLVEAESNPTGSRDRRAAGFGAVASRLLEV